MQKVIRRTLMAEKQAARRAAKRAEMNARSHRWNLIETNTMRGQREREVLRNAHNARREDWEMGGLAPKRDIGVDRETYGTVDSALYEGKELRREERNEMLKQLKERYQTIVVGDRVVLLEGPDKGKIGLVKSKNVKRGQLVVDGLNKVWQSVEELGAPG